MNEDEVVIIPINMRDGVIVGRGKGNADWNFSAPHCSGRILKRTEVKNHHTLSEYKSARNGIYSTIITKKTLEESPFAYRGIENITEAITETVEIEKILRSVYRFKLEVSKNKIYVWYLDTLTKAKFRNRAITKFGIWLATFT